MIRGCFIFVLLHFTVVVFSQDTTILSDNDRVTLPEVWVRNNFDYRKLLKQIKEDTTFYKAFRNLRILNFTSFNDIKMLEKKGAVKASLFSKTRQNRSNGCRTMDVLEEKVTGDFYDARHNYNYLTPELYAGLFFTKDKVCGENNIVKGRNLSISDKKGIDKHKDQLKMLFFNPGKKIPGIPVKRENHFLSIYSKHAFVLRSDIVFSIQCSNKGKAYLMRMTHKCVQKSKK